MASIDMALTAEIVLNSQPATSAGRCRNLSTCRNSGTLRVLKSFLALKNNSVVIAIYFISGYSGKRLYDRLMLMLRFLLRFLAYKIIWLVFAIQIGV